MWDPSFRYFRLSQASNDLFDAYRNAYLALESLLGTVAPQEVPGEGERAWFRRALGEAGKLIQLAGFVPPGTSDPLDYLVDDLFVGNRSAMFHAKSGRTVLLPRASTATSSVADSLWRPVHLYLALAQAHLSVRRRSASWSQHAFQLMLQPTFDNMIAYASDDESPWAADGNSANPGGALSSRSRLSDLPKREVPS